MDQPDNRIGIADQWREKRRMQAVKLHQQGWQTTKIAEALEVTVRTVQKWLKRSAEQGIEALRAVARSGRRSELSDEQQVALGQLLDQGAEAFGYKNAVWTTDRIAVLIKEHFGVSYHRNHVGRVLQRMGYSYTRPVVSASQRDEQEVTRWVAEAVPGFKKK